MGLARDEPKAQFEIMTEPETSLRDFLGEMSQETVNSVKLSS